jgi:hypothetical protein
VKSCSECGYSNDFEAPACVRCGFRFAPPPRTGAARRPGIPLALLLAILLLGGTAAIAAKLAAARHQLSQVRVRLERELRDTDQAREKEWVRKRADDERRARDEEAAHTARLQNTALVSGELARSNRAAEWQKRVAHDQEFAHSALERSILKMQKVGSDPALAAREALEEVARLATPPGSRIEITNAYDKLAMRVAFKMSAVIPSAAGVAMKHKSTASMRREAEEGAACIMKELFDHCGPRGIARLSLSCNYAVYSHSYIPKAATEAERKELEKRGAVIMSCLYRISIDASKAATVPSWRAISIPRVMELMRVDYDGIGNLKIGDLPLNVPLNVDPDMQLEF